MSNQNLAKEHNQFLCHNSNPANYTHTWSTCSACGSSHQRRCPPADVRPIKNPLACTGMTLCLKKLSRPQGTDFSHPIVIDRPPTTSICLQPARRSEVSFHWASRSILDDHNWLVQLPSRELFKIASNMLFMA